MVKKPSLRTTQAKETRQGQPSQMSIERLRKLKEQSGMMMWNKQKIRRGLEELSLDMKRRVMLWKELDTECFDLDHPMIKQEEDNPPILYKTMRLQHQAVKEESMEEKLLEMRPTLFQSLI